MCPHETGVVVRYTNVVVVYATFACNILEEVYTINSHTSAVLVVVSYCLVDRME